MVELDCGGLVMEGPNCGESAIEEPVGPVGMVVLAQGSLGHW